MTSIYTLLSYGVWTSMFLVWVFGRLGNKKTVRRFSVSKYLLTTILLYLSYLILFLPPFPKNMAVELHPEGWVLGSIGAVICFLGAAFAILGRFALGRNWSGVVAMQKEGHELVRTGPYGIVRHPIYAGFFLAMLGFALTVNTGMAYAAVLVGLLSLVLRIALEERLMKEIFPEAYKEYSAKVSRLIPMVW